MFTHSSEQSSGHSSAQDVERPLIGIPTWNDTSLVYSGVSTYGINQSYVATLQRMGAAPVLIPLYLDKGSLRRIFKTLDGLFLGGGGDIAPRLYEKSSREILASSDLERDITELTLAAWALEDDVPILGVCRGLQILNVACGGTLYRNLSHHGSDLMKHDYIFPNYQRDRISHDVITTDGSYLRNIFGERVGVNSMHCQGVCDLGGGLHVSAHASDGLPEAVEVLSNSFAVGFQWHPEELMKSDARNARIFGDFLDAARTAP